MIYIVEKGIKKVPHISFNLTLSAEIPSVTIW